MFTLVLYLMSSVFVGYNTYRHTWFHVIKIFETLNSASNPIPSLLHTASSANIIQLIAAPDDDVNSKKHIETLKNIARVAFTATVTSTVIIIEFILIELNRDFVTDSTELVSWNMLLLIIVMCLVFVQPAVMCLLLVNRIFKSNVLDNDSTKLVTSISLFVGWLLFVSRSYTLTDLSVVDGVGFVSYYVQRVSIIGVTLMAILNGVGSFSTVYYYIYKQFTPQQKYTSEEASHRVQSLEKSLQNTDNMISTKELELSQADGRANTRPTGSFLNFQPTHLFSRETSEHQVLQSEISSLKMIKNDVYVKLLKAQQAVDERNASESPAYHQRLRTIVSKVISYYCIFKILQVTTVHLIQFIKSHDINTSKSDPLVLTLSHILEIFYPVEDEEFLISQLSFAISGILFICSFNGVFMTLTHLYRFLPIDLSKLNSSSQSSTKRKQNSVSVIKNLVVSELLGIYVIATITILKSNLTTTAESKLSELMLTTGMEIVVMDNWFDKVFLVSVVCTGVVIRLGEMWMNDGFEDQDVMGKIV